MRLSCGLGIEVHANRKAEILDVLNRVNAMMWAGHFGLDDHGNKVSFRHTTMFRGISASGAEHIEAMVECALEACELYYTTFLAFQAPVGAANDNAGQGVDLGFMLAQTQGNA